MRSKGQRIVVAGVCSVFALFLIVMAAGIADCAEKTISLSKSYAWKMTSSFPAGHMLNRSAVEFARAVEQATNGGVKITIYEGTLGAPPDHWEMVKKDAIQIAFMGEAHNVGRLPVISMTNLPFELPDTDAAMKVAGEWMKAGYLKELTDSFKVLYLVPTNLQSPFFRNKKVASLADLKGIKLRSVSGIQGQTVSALGGTGVSLMGSEVYMALQTGIIDGTVTGVDFFVDTKLYEPAKFALRQPIYGGMFMLVMNKEVWNGLPKELQNFMDQISMEVSAKDVKKRNEEETAYWETVRKNKVEVYTISPDEAARWKKATETVADKYVQEWAAKGFPVKQALEVMRKTTGRK
jgi:TRAP-type transport system periplasmic protein